jgi:hypothetical protein
MSVDQRDFVGEITPGRPFSSKRFPFARIPAPPLIDARFPSNSIHIVSSQAIDGASNIHTVSNYVNIKRTFHEHLQKADTRYVMRRLFDDPV